MVIKIDEFHMLILMEWIKIEERGGRGGLDFFSFYYVFKLNGVRVMARP